MRFKVWNCETENLISSLFPCIGQEPTYMMHIFSKTPLPSTDANQETSWHSEDSDDAFVLVKGYQQLQMCNQCNHWALDLQTLMRLKKDMLSSSHMKTIICLTSDGNVISLQHHDILLHKTVRYRGLQRKQHGSLVTQNYVYLIRMIAESHISALTIYV